MDLNTDLPVTVEEDQNIYIRRIQELARDPDCKDYLAANKYLLEEPWKKAKVGRPSKEAIAQEASRLVEDMATVEEHYNRIFNRKP